jgi:hypothetical protein
MSIGMLADYNKNAAQGCDNGTTNKTSTVVLIVLSCLGIVFSGAYIGMRKYYSSAGTLVGREVTPDLDD